AARNPRRGNDSRHGCPALQEETGPSCKDECIKAGGNYDMKEQRANDAKGQRAKGKGLTAKDETLTFRKDSKLVLVCFFFYLFLVLTPLPLALSLLPPVV